MGLVFAFAFGYVVGAKAGEQGFEDVVAAAKALAASEEVRGLISVLRSHASSTLQELSTLLAEQPDEPVVLGQVLDRVTGLMARSGFRAPES